MLTKIKHVKSSNVKSKRYDITTKKNHNFFANDILVHNCQNLDHDELKRHGIYSVTEKCDGSSVSCYLRDGTFGVCSRNLELKESEDNTFWKTVRALKVEEYLRSFAPNNVCLQGELLGPGIQGNKYKLNEHTILFFTGYDIDTRRRWTNEELVNKLSASDHLQTVPMLSYKFLLPQTIAELLEFAEGKSQLNKDTEREGVVIRNVTDPTISFKVISNRFLLKEKD